MAQSSITTLIRLPTRILQPGRPSLYVNACAGTAIPNISAPAATFSIRYNALSFSTSTSNLARGRGAGQKKDPRITLIRYHLMHPQVPRPLRLSRLRALRHWTIHRAWMLFRRKKALAEELELERMYRSMHNACEELRLLDGPGEKDSGRLYRIAMEKKGIFRPGGLPIEYARHQTETPGREAWNHAWTR